MNDPPTILQGDALEQLPTLIQDSVDAVVTDPPYGLSFMGRAWDSAVPMAGFWGEVLRVAKPGAHLLAFGGTRTFHRLACAIEDSGWQMRDTLMWIYGQGFPKSLDVSKALDKTAGATRDRIRGVRSGVVRNAYAQDVWSLEHKDSVLSPEPITEDARQWDGWGTALKPAWEPIILARKPLEQGLTVAQNVVKWRTGALNVAGGRVGGEVITQRRTPMVTWRAREGRTDIPESAGHSITDTVGRWPANVIHDGSEEVEAMFPYSTSRFFYCAKAQPDDREEGNTHPTVKPTALLRHLCRLIAPPGGVVLDPFMGSGSTGKAAMLEGLRFIGIELEAGYLAIARVRIEAARRQGHLPFEAFK